MVTFVLFLMAVVFLPFFDVCLLITPLVSSDSSYSAVTIFKQTLLDSTSATALLKKYLFAKIKIKNHLKTRLPNKR